MNKLKISTRIALLTALSSLLLLLVGTIGLLGMKQADDALLDSYERRAVPTGFIADIQARLLQNRLLIATAMVTPTPEVITENTAAIEKNIAAITDTWKRYAAMPLEGKERELADKFAINRGAFVAEGLKPTIAALRDGNLDRAKQLVVDKVRPLYGPVGEGIQTLMQFQLDQGKQNYTDADDRYQATQIEFALIMALGLTLGIGLGWALARNVSASLQQAVAASTAVANGDLTQEIHADGDNEVATLMRTISGMKDKLSAILTGVMQTAQGVATASEQISQGNHDLSSRTEQQASAVEQTAASMEQISGTVKQNAANVSQANQLASTASGVASSGGDVVGRVVHTMKNINESSKKIADIIGVIDGIAFQTNILALNAAVEAARAGEQGRGFAVVAAEVRNLAQRSAEAAKEIKTLISASVETVEQGTALVDQAGVTMNDVVTSIQRVTQIMAEISTASHEQSSGVLQVGQALSEMDRVTQQNAALVEESAAAAEALRRQSQEMVNMVSVFKLKDRARAPAPAH